jgi:hypothetical protein
MDATGAYADADVADGTAREDAGGGGAGGSGPAHVMLPLPGPVLRTSDGVRRLAELAVVPVLPPSRTGAVFAYAPAPQDATAGRELVDQQHAPARPVAEPLLLRYKDCVLPADAHLAWTVLPVVPPALVPPALALTVRVVAQAAAAAAPGAASGGTGGAAHQAASAAAAADASSTVVGALGIASPPPRAVVMRHVRHLTGHLALEEAEPSSSAPSANATDLDRWAYPDPPAAVFTSIFKFLDGPAGWAALPPGDQALLQTLPLIPVGPALLPPHR